jgi:hypothetical protein
LNREGFVVEQSDQRDNYGVYFNNLAHFKETDEKWLTEELQQSNTPLIRYGRWPNRAKSALSITGDIDSMTLGDFALRILENWQHNGKQRSISA